MQEGIVYEGDLEEVDFSLIEILEFGIIRHKTDSRVFCCCLIWISTYPGII